MSKKRYKTGADESPEQEEQPEQSEQSEQGDVQAPGNPADPAQAPEVVSDPPAGIPTIQGVVSPSYPIPGVPVPGAPASSLTPSGVPIGGLVAGQVSAISQPVQPPVVAEPGVATAPEQQIDGIRSAIASTSPLPGVGHPDLIPVDPNANQEPEEKPEEDPKNDDPSEEEEPKEDDENK